jgi:hypothetical protein
VLFAVHFGRRPLPRSPTPLGLVQPTTLPFGQKNSGTEAQGPYRAAASEMNRGRHGNYVDDWIGYGDELDQLIEDFERFLNVREIQYHSRHSKDEIWVW